MCIFVILDPIKIILTILKLHWNIGLINKNGMHRVGIAYDLIDWFLKIAEKLPHVFNDMTSFAF